MNMFGSASRYRFPDEDRPKRHDAPVISVYFINDVATHPPHKLACMFCKRTIADGVTGQIDKIIDTPLPADDFDLALNIQCKLCGQKWRVLGAPKAVTASQPQQI